MIAGLAKVAALAAALLLAPSADAREIAADLSAHEIDITAGFDGAELLLYGHDASTADVLVIVRGPDKPIAVRRKERVAGIWVNGKELSFDRAPSFYFVSVTDGLRARGELEAILEETGLGARYLGMTAAGDNPDAVNFSTPVVEEFRHALIELQSRNRLYATTPGRVEMRPDGLFRTKVPFPAGTPVGAYTVTVYHVVDGWPVAGASAPLIVRKAGFGAYVYEFAHLYPPLYGLIAILVALGAGWFGGWAFRRG